METFKRLLAYAKPYRRFWPGYLILSIFSVIFGVVNYALIDPLLTVLFDSDTVATSATLPEFSLTIDYFYSLFEYYLVKIIGATTYKSIRFAHRKTLSAWRSRQDSFM